MGLSREARIITLLAIDSAFFFLEIIVGYAVGSLALVADSFHMLNDVMSLVVALYALKLSKKENTSDPRYSYGWQRAEILGALVNGVFLLALCFSIFMEAIERFVNVTEVSNPRLVIIVGSLGLASNIVGLFLFHDHGHAHGGHSHSHGGSKAHSHSHDEEHAGTSDSPGPLPAGTAPHDHADDGHDHERTHGRHGSTSSLYGHPAQTRAYVVQTAQTLGYERQGKSIQIQGGERDRLTGGDSNSSQSSSSGAGYGSIGGHDIESGKKTKTGLFGRDGKLAGANEHEDELDDNGLPSAASALAHRLPGSQKAKPTHNEAGDGHGHNHSSGGHSHDGEMNMRGVFLHVLGDALGNVGVIAAGVFIMVTSYWWRFYADPLISFIITIIIFHSALPLVKSASFILLQGVPTGVPLEEVRRQMLDVDGVLSVHELHIWQLSESKIVASVHVLVDCSSGQEQKYMTTASSLRSILHRYGIHSSTIQPEFVQGGIHEAARISGVEVADQQTDDQGRLITKDGKLVEHELSRNPSSCLLACDDASCAEASCCPPTQRAQISRQPSSSTLRNARSEANGSEDRHDHEHSHGSGHNH